MNHNSYTVVTLDGKEKQNLSLDELKDLFFRRQINQSSLVSSGENPQWVMLKRAFDLSLWIPANSGVPAAAPPAANFQPPANPFEQQNSANQPVTFNQFPQNQSHQPTPNYAAGQSTGYTQNNQSHSYFQAEKPQSQYNYQNNQAKFSGNSYQNSSNRYNYPSNYQTSNSDERNGARPAAVFLLINALFYVIYMIAASFKASAPGGSEAYNAGYNAGRYGLPILLLIIDLSLANKLWKNNNVESARKSALLLRYCGLIIWGILVPFVTFVSGGAILGFFFFIWAFLYFISIALLLHGKENPTQSRVMIGVGTFAIYFLMTFGILALSSVAMLGPNFGNLDVSSSKFEKYKIEGSEFQDKTTGAKVSLPEGWMMVSTSNPLMSSPQARMIAVGKKTDSLTMLEVVPVPANVDIKRTNTNELLEFLADYVSKNMAEELKKGNPSLSSTSAREITRMSISVGTHPAKLLVMETSMNRQKFKSHMIITVDELSMYILHSWCPTGNYETAKDEFYALEKSFTIPDKINSPFTQSAENEKNKTTSKSNF